MRYAVRQSDHTAVINAVAEWCDTTETASRARFVSCGEPRCVLCMTIAARLECVAQVRALLSVDPQTNESGAT